MTLVQELGQPSLAIDIDRAQDRALRRERRRHQQPDQHRYRRRRGHEVVQGEKEFDLVVRLRAPVPRNPEEIGNIPVATPGGQQIPLKEFADIKVTNGASFIYREDNSRYIGVQFSVEGRDLAGAVEDAIDQVKQKVALPQGYRLDWGGEYTEYTASRAQTGVHSAADLFLIFLCCSRCTAISNSRSLRCSALCFRRRSAAFSRCGSPARRSRCRPGIGFLALFGVSVQTAVVYISYVNELRRGGMAIGAKRCAKGPSCGCARS